MYHFISHKKIFAFKFIDLLFNYSFIIVDNQKLKFIESNNIIRYNFKITNELVIKYQQKKKKQLKKQRIMFIQLTDKMGERGY